jgi:hypothetical protein
MTKYCCTHQGVGGFGSDVAFFDRLNPNRGCVVNCVSATLHSPLLPKIIEMNNEDKHRLHIETIS